jgi:hypothetical protein
MIILSDRAGPLRIGRVGATPHIVAIVDHGCPPGSHLVPANSMADRFDAAQGGQTVALRITRAKFGGGPYTDR